MDRIFFIHSFVDGHFGCFQVLAMLSQCCNGGAEVKASACNAGDQGSIPGWGRSPGERKGYQLQYSGLENSMECTVHGVAKSQT